MIFLVKLNSFLSPEINVKIIFKGAFVHYVVNYSIKRLVLCFFLLYPRSVEPLKGG